MKNTKITGSCLCGEVSFQFKGSIKVFQYCHCSRCQKSTGSAHASNIIIEPSQFKWLNGEYSVGRFELPDAKHFATSFCTKCGSSLPWLTQSGKAIVIPAGSLDDDPMVSPTHSIFYTDRAPWYKRIDDLKQYEQLPIKQ